MFFFILVNVEWNALNAALQHIPHNDQFIRAFSNWELDRIYYFVYFDCSGSKSFYGNKLGISYLWQYLFSFPICCICCYHDWWILHRPVIDVGLASSEIPGAKTEEAAVTSVGSWSQRVGAVSNRKWMAPDSGESMSLCTSAEWPLKT